MYPLKLATGLAISLVAIAACGGPAAVPTVGPGATPGSVATQASAATTGPITATEPAATTAPVGNTVDLCSLLSPEDLNAALGKDTYVAGVPDDFGQCSWNVEGGTWKLGQVVLGAKQEKEHKIKKNALGQG